MADWVTVRGDRPGGLFLPLNKGGRVVGERIGGQAVYDILRKRLGQAGVARLSPHDWMCQNWDARVVGAGPTAP
ncbi:MAG: hypothetical protein M3Q65_18390 [Chloroflexota bacterium]|nr:hypothetical protein [Chloroflexota bacterium]